MRMDHVAVVAEAAAGHRPLAPPSRPAAAAPARDAGRGFGARRPAFRGRGRAGRQAGRGKGGARARGRGRGRGRGNPARAAGESEFEGEFEEEWDADDFEELEEGDEDGFIEEDPDEPLTTSAPEPVARARSSVFRHAVVSSSSKVHVEFDEDSLTPNTFTLEAARTGGDCTSSLAVHPPSSQSSSRISFDPIVKVKAIPSRDELGRQTFGARRRAKSEPVRAGHYEYPEPMPVVAMGRGWNCVVPVHIGGVRFRVTCDTGAARNLARVNFVDQLRKITRTKSFVGVRARGDRTINSFVKVWRLEQLSFARR